MSNPHSVGPAPGRAYALLVMPDPQTRRVCEQVLRDEGLPSCAVEDGESAMAVIEDRGAPRLVVTELSLPRVDGFAMLEDLRRRCGRDQTAVVVMSAFEELRRTATELREQLGIAWIVARESCELFLSHAVHEAVAGADLPEQHISAASVIRSEQRHSDPRRAARVEELVDDGPPDELLQAIVADTARKFSVPVALVSLVLPDRQWFKAHFGLGGELLEKRSTPVSQAFCRHAVDAAETLVVPDATRHPYFRNNELVQAGAVGSYAGAPLITPGGDVLGTLCIIDSKPLSVSVEQVRDLETLARYVVGELERAMKQRRAPKSSGFEQAAVAFLGSPLEEVDKAVVLFRPDGRVRFASRSAAKILGIAVEAMLGKDRSELLQAVAPHSEDPSEFQIRLSNPRRKPFAYRGQFGLLRPARRVRWVEEPLPSSEGTGQVCCLTDVSAGERNEDQPGNTPFTLGGALTHSSRTMLREIAGAAKAGATVQFVRVQVNLPPKAEDAADADEQKRWRAHRQVGSILHDYAPAGDLALPWGPTEYLVLLPRSDEEAARAFAESVQTAVRACRFEVRPVEVVFGLAELPPEGDLHMTLACAGAEIYRQQRSQQKIVVGGF